jgi:hypothetical protein
MITRRQRRFVIGLLFLQAFVCLICTTDSVGFSLLGRLTAVMIGSADVAVASIAWTNWKRP